MNESSVAAPIETFEWTFEGLRERLHEKPDVLFAILDACDEPRVLAKVSELGSARAVSLYRGWAEQDYRDIAPYLVQVDEALLNWIGKTLWDDPWGVFAVAKTGLHELRRHFRRFLLVQDPEGKQMYFRFYDPRVLTTFLDNCDAGEAEQFFGPVAAYGVRGGEESVKWLRVQNREATP